MTINRRNFLTGAGAACVVLLSRNHHSFAQPNRKEIFIGGRRVTVVDIHAHCLFQEVAPIIQNTSMENADLGNNLVLGPHRVEALNERGIDIAALSVNRFWWYAANPQQARD
ncbi:MAG: twin-arginine translocation signal domain-containing protein, partial [Gammaproteobacteria bacterium]